MAEEREVNVQTWKDWHYVGLHKPVKKMTFTNLSMAIRENCLLQILPYVITFCFVEFSDLPIYYVPFMI